MPINSVITLLSVLDSKKITLLKDPFFGGGGGGGAIEDDNSQVGEIFCNSLLIPKLNPQFIRCFVIFKTEKGVFSNYNSLYILRINIGYNI